MEDFPSCMLQLYDRILHKQKSGFAVKDEAVKRAIQIMQTTYRPNKNWQNFPGVIIANYDDAAHRCAYLHKYAVCYTGMVHYLLNIAVSNSDILMAVLEEKENIRICSLGGGPGTDAIAILEVFYQWFNFSYCNIRIIDYLQQWENVFASIIDELQTGSYGDIEDAVLPQHFEYEYIQANLLETFSPIVTQAIRNSDFVSMVKFISAAACCKTKLMVQEIFYCMHPGAFLLYIDNDGGGFLKMAQKVAQQCNMLTIFGPMEHFEYSNENYCRERYGYLSQVKSKVSMQIWMKPLNQPRAEMSISNSYQPSVLRNSNSQPPTFSNQFSPVRNSQPQQPNLNHQYNPATKPRVQQPIFNEPTRMHRTTNSHQRNVDNYYNNTAPSQNSDDDNIACCTII